MSNDYQQVVTATIFDEASFIKATFKGAQKGKDVAWRQVTVRPVQIKGNRYLQFSYLDQQKDISKNYTLAEATSPLQALLETAFKTIHLESSVGIIQIQITKKGRGIIHRRLGEAVTSPNFAHNRSKNYLLPEDAPLPFLQEIGIMTQDGKIRSAMRNKFRQINAFLDLIQHTNGMAELKHSPLHMVDFGCGSAHLSFALYHYFNVIREHPATLTGIDLKTSLIQKHRKTSRTLGWDQLWFKTGAIIDYQPENRLDLVLALHACDTATDEALYQAITAGSQFIFAAPCCHKHLNQQLNQITPPKGIGPLFEDGILKSRQGDLLTDTFRATILRLMGYQTDVIEFISTDHTARNVMIRATKRSHAPKIPKQLGKAYQAMKDFWQVTPYLETLLQDELTAKIIIK